MFKAILRGITQRWTTTSKWGMASWTFDQLTSLTNIAFGATGAVLMSTKVPGLTAFLTSGVSINSLVVDTKSIFKHRKKITKGGWVGVGVMELGSLAATTWAIVTYCKTTLDENSTSDAQETAAKLNIASAVIAYTVSPLVRKIIGSFANSLEAGENGQQGALTLEQAREQIAALTGERDAARGQVVTLTGERDAAQGQVVTLTGERDVAQGQVVTLTRERDAAQGQVVTLTEERDVAQRQVVTLTGERDVAQGQVVTLTGERDAAQGQVVILTKERDAAQIKLVQLRTQNAALTSGQCSLRFFNETESHMPQPSFSDTNYPHLHV